MIRKRHLRYFNSQEEYEKALENGELSIPRVCVWIDKQNKKNFSFNRLRESLIRIDDTTLLGCDDNTYIAI